MSIRQIVVPGHITTVLLIVVTLIVGCAPPVKVMEVEVTAVPRVGFVEVTATPTPAPTVTPTPKVNVEPASFRTEDGVELSGYVYGGEGDMAVLLAPMNTGDQHTWAPFARLVAERGSIALTFDYRGRGESASGGTAEHDLGCYRDAQAAIEFLQRQGFGRIVCMGTVQGGAACMNVALKNELVGLVLISSQMPRRVIRETYPRDLVSPNMPKLIVSTEANPYDLEVVRAAPRLYEMSPEPKEIHVFPVAAHGIELFDTEHGDEFQELLLSFLEGISQTVTPALAATSVPVSVSLPALQPMTSENAADVVQLRTLEWPEDFARQDSSGGQCSVAYDADGRTLGAACLSKDIPIWDVKTGQLVDVLVGHEAPVVSLAFGPDRRMIASGGLDATIRLWEVTTGELLDTLEGHSRGVWGLAFSADGEMLASCGLDRSIRLWDVATRQQLYELVGHRGAVLSVAFSPDGQMLASGSVDHTVRLWYAGTGEHMYTLEGPKGNVGHVTFSPDGHLLASASDDDLIRLWDAGTGDLLRVLEGHEDWVNGVTFSPDGRLLASGSHDGTVGLWDVGSGQLLRRLEGHGNVVLRGAFGPDGHLLATVSWDGTVRLWGVVSSAGALGAEALGDTM